MELDAVDGWKIIQKARERKARDKMYLLYVSIYSNFTKDNFMTFDDFIKKSTTKITAKTKEQIVEDVEKIRQKFEERE